MFTSIRASNGYAECVEWSTTGPMGSVKGGKTLKGGNLLWKLTPESQQIPIGPLCRRFLGQNRSNSLDPIGVGVHTVIGQSEDECAHRGIDDFILKGSGLTRECFPGILRAGFEKKMEEFCKEAIVTPSEFINNSADILSIVTCLSVDPRISRDCSESKGFRKITE